MPEFRVVALVLVCLAVVPEHAIAAEKPVVFRDVNVIPMTHETVLRGQTVIVRGDRIEAIGPSDSVKVPRRATVIDGSGHYLIPGLVDLHTHFFAGKRSNPDLLKLCVVNGVTAVLNMRGSRGSLELRERVHSGEIIGPEIYAASPILGNASPNPSTFEKGVAAVEQFAAQGYDFIKVYNQIPEDGYRGVMDAARRLDIPVIGHAVRSVGIEGALQSGQHIAHMEEVIYGYFTDGLDEEAIPNLARRFKESGVYVVATLITYHNIIRQVDDIGAMLASPGIEYLPARLTDGWQPDRNVYLARFDQDVAQTRLRPAFAFQQKLTKAFNDVGVPILLGTDASIPIVVPGYSAHDELRELVDAGLSPYEALASGTSRASAFLGGGDDFGTIEIGKRADLILLERNPLEDIRHSRAIGGVMLRGTWFDQVAIQEMLDEILRVAEVN